MQLGRSPVKPEAVQCFLFRRILVVCFYTDCLGFDILLCLLYGNTKSLDGGNVLVLDVIHRQTLARFIDGQMLILGGFYSEKNGRNYSDLRAELNQIHARQQQVLTIVQSTHFLELGKPFLLY